MLKRFEYLEHVQRQVAAGAERTTMAKRNPHVHDANRTVVGHLKAGAIDGVVGAERKGADVECAPKLEFITRRPRFIGEWGECDLCGQSFTRRWLFEKTTRGEIFVCVSCRERMTHKSKGEALDSWARLPGSYGG